jgi:hypothetical protein
MEPRGPFMLVVDVAVQMRLGPKTHIAAGAWASVRLLMVCFVVTVHLVKRDTSRWPLGLGSGWDDLLQLAGLVKDTTALQARKCT